MPITDWKDSDDLEQSWLPPLPPDVLTHANDDDEEEEEADEKPQGPPTKDDVDPEC